MKRILLLACFALLGISANAQVKSNLGLDLGKTPDYIIKWQNILSADTVLGQHLIDAQAMSEGGFYLVYRENNDEKSEFIYYFNKQSKCFAFKTIFDISAMGDELKTLSDECNKINDHTLYAKTENVKVTFYTDEKNQLVVFVYTRKETQVPHL